jgi:Flp pilus assembly protein TadD
VRFAELDYLLAQSKILPEYLASGLGLQRPIFDYGPLTEASASGAWPWLVTVGVIVAALCALAFTHPRAGFSGVWVLGVLAPTSTLFSIHTEVGAERRFYLPLIGVLAVAVVLVDAGLRRVGERARRSVVAWGTALAIAATLGLGVRARSYASAFADLDSLWRHAVAARPENPRAYYNLAETSRRAGDAAGAEVALRHAIALHPRYVDARVNLAGILMAKPEPERALVQLREATRHAAAGDVRARFNLGVALGVLGRMDEAARELAVVVRESPDDVEARFKLAIALRELRRVDEAHRQLARMKRSNPGDPRVVALERALSPPPPAQ